MNATTNNQLKVISLGLEKLSKATRTIEERFNANTKVRQDLHSATFHIGIALKAIKRAAHELEDATI